MKYIVTSTGLEAREKNIYTNFHKVQHPGFPFDESRRKWQEFEESVKTYPLTQPMLPGSEIEGELVWQYKHADEWLVNQQQPYKMDSIPDLYKRQALQPIPQPEKVKEETVDIRELAKVNFIKGVIDRNDSEFLEGRPLEEFYDEGKLYWFQNGSEFGWKANNEHQHKATIDKVVEVIGLWIDELENATGSVNNNIATIKIQTLTDLLTQIKEI